MEAWKSFILEHIPEYSKLLLIHVCAQILETKEITLLSLELIPANSQVQCILHKKFQFDFVVCPEIL